MGKILDKIFSLKKQHKKALAILIDPDNLSQELLPKQITLAKENSVDFFFIGGSMITEDCLGETIDFLKLKTTSLFLNYRIL